jgi:trans-aconitate 2-methyltransferase
VWNPEQYSRYSNERSRPFFDLLAQVHHPNPRTIIDLGCGSGELTAAMGERWPGARIHGVDSSPEMIAEANAYTVPERVTFEIGDLQTWRAAGPVDILISNAAYQWVPDHETLLPRLTEMVAPGGVFAFQVPGNFDAPSHQILAGLRGSPRWNDKLGGGASRSAAVQSPEWYLGFLIERGMQVDAWETTYLHILQGENAVLEWVKGTALRPVLARLDRDEQDSFLAEYAALLSEAYPPQSFGTVFPFRRIFVVAEKGA